MRGVRANVELGADQIDEWAPLDEQSSALLRAALGDGRLSARGLARVRLVARTIADLADRDVVEHSDVAMALALRARPVLFEACHG